jgi:hypothetical protein
LSTCCGLQKVVPIGGTFGGCSGVTEGGTMGQTVGAQMGGRSIALEHIGWIEPLTHRHTQLAWACPTKIA